MPQTKYICYRCNNFDTIRFTEIKNHILRKNPCNKKKELILLSEDQIFISTLMPYYNDIHSIDNKDIEYLEKSSIIYKNKNELFEEIINIEKNKLKKCKYCDEHFEHIMDLKKHIILRCFYNTLIKRVIDIDNANINISNNIIDSNNTTNINNNYNNCDINNINLYLDINTPTPIPFEDSWDMSKISNEKQFFIMMSEYMYTHLLEAILENDVNNNVIIDSDKKSGSVYMNHNDKYISMKAKQIVEKSMEKLNMHLNIINKTNKSTRMKDVIRFSRQIFNKKYIDYQNDKDLKKNVNNVMSNIFEGKRDDAQKLAENLVKVEEYHKQIKLLEKKSEIHNDEYESDSDIEIDINGKKGY
jgi:hypothetical protein